MVNAFGTQVIHDGVDLDVRRGEVIGIVGGSGTGKSVMLRTVVGLNRPVSGSIEVLGHDVLHIGDEERHELETHWGVLFQDGALFSSLTVAQNIEVPLKEDLALPSRLMAEIAATKIGMVGLPAEAADKFPAQLSGGMRKRAGLARALALDPDILFLDEPTAGLDPIAAAAFDQLIKDLRSSLGLTVFLVTHDLDSLFAICDRVAVLVDKKIKVGTLEEHLRDDHPWIHSYFHGPRGRAAHPDRRTRRGRGQEGPDGDTRTLRRRRRLRADDAVPRLCRGAVAGGDAVLDQLRALRHLFRRAGDRAQPEAAGSNTNGIPVGTVSDIEIVNDQQILQANGHKPIRVTIEIKSGVQIKKMDSATIQTNILSGVSYILIEPGKSEEMLEAQNGERYPVIRSKRATLASLAARGPAAFGQARCDPRSSR